MHYVRLYLPEEHQMGNIQFTGRGGGARQNDTFSNKRMARCVWLTWNKNRQLPQHTAKLGTPTFLYFAFLTLLLPLFPAFSSLFFCQCPPAPSWAGGSTCCVGTGGYVCSVPRRTDDAAWKLHPLHQLLELVSSVGDFSPQRLWIFYNILYYKIKYFDIL